MQNMSPWDGENQKLKTSVIGKVVFNRAFNRTEGNLIKAREILRNSYLSRHAAEHVGGEMANVYYER